MLCGREIYFILRQKALDAVVRLLLDLAFSAMAIFHRSVVVICKSAEVNRAKNFKRAQCHRGDRKERS